MHLVVLIKMDNNLLVMDHIKARKIGRWIELDEGFQVNKQVIYNGEYNAKSMKIGKWIIVFWGNNMCVQGDNIVVVKGQKKIGTWIELDEGFDYYKQVAYNGEYNMKDKKVGRWDIWWKYNGQNKQIGDGSYDQGEDQKKIGSQVEVDPIFYDYKQVTCRGEYNLKGKKVGIWVQIDIKENKKCGEKKKLIIEYYCKNVYEIENCFISIYSLNYWIIIHDEFNDYKFLVNLIREFKIYQLILDMLQFQIKQILISISLYFLSK
ncbi:unnamed protein product [Paramecium sonneborni]|uniref:Uncharacterized protein n=1 Tax=Paramecium sonneborni TaxID=65129 RepID=A0A8S1RKU4_9CILI|nr:unnamed protein product [Paramecium sonneborni]